MIFFLFISRSTFFHIWMHFFALDRGQSSWICLLTKTTIQLNHNAHNQQLPALRYPTSLKLLWLSIYMLECSLCTWIIVLPFYFPSNIVIGVYYWKNIVYTLDMYIWIISAQIMVVCYSGHCCFRQMSHQPKFVKLLKIWMRHISLVALKISVIQN